MEKGKCPVCLCQRAELAAAQHGVDARDIQCPRCGTFRISNTAEIELLQKVQSTNWGELTETSTKLSHALRQRQESNSRVMLTTEIIERILKRDLPRPSEQADLLVRWAAAKSRSPGSELGLDEVELQGVLGTPTPSGVWLVVRHLVQIGFLHTQSELSPFSSPGAAIAVLFFSGWDRAEKLRQGASSYGRGFMAMQFGEKDLDNMLEHCFRPAAKRAGFGLQKLDDVPKAGLIDNRLRVEIQASDFVVADLSHDNSGAYWEAGYAEGLGKPVIYTCKKSKFKRAKTHFDTNHHLTVVWDELNLKEAEDQLTATIRATLPHVAILVDG